MAQWNVSSRRGRFVNSAFPSQKNFWETKLKANVCRNSTFQVNRTKNTTGKRRLTLSNRAAMSAVRSCEGNDWNLWRFHLRIAMFENSGKIYRVFSLTWPASMQIYGNKRKRLHKKRVQLPQDWFRTPTWLPFHCFGTPIWLPWRHMKTLYNNFCALTIITATCNFFTHDLIRQSNCN